jgi:leader peptidase (prepilin peptidase)/N-methyltransferase
MEHEWQHEHDILGAQNMPDTKKYNLLRPGSACPNCDEKILNIDNIPVISYVLLGGRCRNCKSAISKRYPIIEVISGISVGLIAWKFGISSAAIALSVFTLTLITLAAIDLETHLLPDRITLPLIWLGLLYNLNTGYTDINSAVIGAVAGYLILWALYWAFKLITGKEGMGYGDFKMLSAIGACLGWELLPSVILISSVTASVIGLLLIAFYGKKKDAAIPFGPFLAVGALVIAYFGPIFT